MADPDLKWRDTSDVLLGGATHAFGKVPPGANATATTQRLYNDFGGVLSSDDARDMLLVVQARIQGDTEWKIASVDLLNRRAFQIRQIESKSVAVNEAFLPSGEGISIPLADLASGERHVFELRVAPPAGVSEVVTEFKLGVAFIRFQSIANPFAVDPGIHRGIGTGKVTAILDRSIPIAVSGTATFEWPDFSWIYQGIPLVVLDHDETITEVDGSSVALSAGESYIFLAVLDETTTTIIKGDLAVAPSFPANAPAVPAGNRLLGHGERFDDGDAVNMTFTSLDELPDFFAVITSALNATVSRSGGPMVCDGNLIDSGSASTATLTASSTNTVQVVPDGSIGVTLDGSLSQNGAQFLADIITDGSAETSRAERRRWAGRRELITFTFDSSPTGTTTLIWSNPYDRPLYIRSDMVRLMLDAVPGAGNVKADLFIRVDDGARTTIFTSFGSDDRRPVVDTIDATAINEGLPEVLKIDVSEALECDLIVTTATPAWAVVSVVGDIS